MPSSEGIQRNLVFVETLNNKLLVTISFLYTWVRAWRSTERLQLFSLKEAQEREKKTLRLRVKVSPNEESKKRKKLLSDVIFENLIFHLRFHHISEATRDGIFNGDGNGK